MVDSRTANVEYALEADELALEYTLFRTTEKYFDLLNQLVETLGDGFDEDNPFPGFGYSTDDQQQNEDGAKRKLQREVEGLCSTCNNLVIAFQHNHPNAAYSPGRDFNVKILEFLVLLQYWLPRSSRTRVGPRTHWQWPYVGSSERQHFRWPADLPPELLDDIERGRRLETVLRRNWLGIRHQHDNEQQRSEGQESLGENEQPHKRRRLDYDTTHDMEEDDLINDCTSDASEQSNRPSDGPLDPPNQEAPCLNVGIAAGGKSNRRLKPAPRMYGGRDTGGLFMLNLFDLVPRFMDLSAMMCQELGSISDDWMYLANDLMMQSALERLQNMAEDKLTKPSDAPFLTIREDFGARTWIEECFAWGSTSALPSSTGLARIKRELVHLTPNISDTVAGDDVNTRMEADAEVQHATNLADEYTEEYLLDRLHAEDIISAMFNPQTEESHPDTDNDNDINAKTKIKHKPIPKVHKSAQPHDHPTPEYSEWIQRRNANLTSLLDLNIIQIHGSAEFQSFRVRVREICGKHPIQPFLRDLVSYIGILWAANNRDTRKGGRGKPTLVQIEEGGLDGLSKDDFGVFLKRVGLKMGKVRGRDGKVVGSVFKW